MNYKNLYAIRKSNENRIKALCSDIEETSGIYAFYRTDESCIKYVYVGQADNLLKRAAEHLSGFQHIDLSIKKHGLYNEDTNPHGWMVKVECECAQEKLDEKERCAVINYARFGYQLRNKTTGGQGDGKKSIGDSGRGGYLKGKRDGELKALKEIGAAIEKYTCGITSKGGSIADRKTNELNQKLKGAINQ